MAKNSSPSRAPKNGAQLPDDLEERKKNAAFHGEKNKRQAAINTAHTARENNVQIFNANLCVDTDLHVTRHSAAKQEEFYSWSAFAVWD